MSNSALDRLFLTLIEAVEDMYTDDTRYSSNFPGSEGLDSHSPFWHALFHAKNVTKEGLIRFCKKISEFVWRPSSIGDSKSSFIQCGGN